MFDWTGDFNTYAVPFEFYDAPVVNRFYSARIAAFIRALAYAGGTDVTLTPYEPYDEPAIVPPVIRTSRTRADRRGIRRATCRADRGTTSSAPTPTASATRRATRCRSVR